MKVKLIVLAVFVIFITGCASEGMKAPCDQYASFCSNKTKINHW